MMSWRQDSDLLCFAASGALTVVKWWSPWCRQSHETLGNAYIVLKWIVPLPSIAHIVSWGCCTWVLELTHRMPMGQLCSMLPGSSKSLRFQRMITHCFIGGLPFWLPGNGVWISAGKNCQNSTSELRTQNCLSWQEVVHKADGPAEQAGCLLAIHQTAKYLSPFESIFSLWIHLWNTWFTYGKSASQCRSMWIWTLCFARSQVGRLCISLPTWVAGL